MIQRVAAILYAIISLGVVRAFLPLVSSGIVAFSDPSKKPSQ